MKFTLENGKLDSIIQIKKSEFERLEKEHRMMIYALQVIRDSFWTEPSESKKHLELQNDARECLEKIDQIKEIKK